MGSVCNQATCHRCLAKYSKPPSGPLAKVNICFECYHYLRQFKSVSTCASAENIEGVAKQLWIASKTK